MLLRLALFLSLAGAAWSVETVYSTAVTASDVVEIDAEGNVYTAGKVQGLPPIGHNIAVTKLDPQGKAVFTSFLAGTGVARFQITLGSELFDIGNIWVRAKLPEQQCYTRPMIRLSVMYPAAPGSRFDWNYYLGQHRELAKRLLGSRGLVRTEIDRGIAGLPPAGPPYHAIGHLFFRSMAELQTALEATAAQFIADERNYTDVPSVVQISEVVE